MKVFLTKNLNLTYWSFGLENGEYYTLVEWNMVLLNGDKVDMKYYAYFKFNSDHKIVSANEFFDAGSYIKLASEAAEKVKK